MKTRHSVRYWALSLLAAPLLLAGAAHGQDRPKILVTGYWPPTNEMIRQFSANPEQNPDGWMGENWEGRGYDIYAFFPEFEPPDCYSCGKGTGDLEVDYQDTVADYWPIVDTVQPAAVITFSRGSWNKSWELEMNQYNRTNWIADYLAPYYPTPSPPDDTVPPETLRESMLPVNEIRQAILDADLGLYTFIDYYGDGGGFLSEFMAYHGVWYQDIHKNELNEARCVTAGHIHVGGQVDWDTAEAATEVTIRTVIDYVDSILPSPADINGDGVVDVLDLLEVLSNWGPCEGCPADINFDGVVDVLDLLAVLGDWG